MPHGHGEGADGLHGLAAASKFKLLKFPVRAKHPSKTCRESQFLQQDPIGWIKTPPGLLCAGRKRIAWGEL